MTSTQALSRARKILGKKVHIEERKPSRHFDRCAIGRNVSVIGMPIFSIYASGDNWQEAIDRLEEKARNGETDRLI